MGFERIIQANSFINSVWQNKLLLFFLSCSKSYLHLQSECGDLKLCGDKTNIDSNVFISCTNIVTITYVSTEETDIDDELRGFNFYYEGNL